MTYSSKNNNVNNLSLILIKKISIPAGNKFLACVFLVFIEFYNLLMVSINIELSKKSTCSHTNEKNFSML